MSRRTLLLLAMLSALWRPAAAETAADPWRLGPPPDEFVLDNGLRVVAQRVEDEPITVVQLLVGGGDRDDPPGMPGLAYLTARLCLEVSEAERLRQLVDFGSSFSLDVGGDGIRLTIRALSPHLDATLDAVVSMLAAPLLSDVRIDGIKGFMRALQKQEGDDAFSIMAKTAAAAFYDRPAYGASRFGTEESLRRIGRRDIQEFHRAHFAAGNMAAFVASDLGADRLRPILDRRLGRLAAGPRLAAAPPATLRPGDGQRRLERRTSQSLVAVVAALPPPSAANLAAATLFESWLGHGVGSRLWSLRSRAGLAYGLGAELWPNRGGMLLGVFLRTQGERLPEARAELERLLRQIREEGIDEAGLAAAKTYARSRHWRQNELRERRAAFLAFFEEAGLSWRLAGDFAAALERVRLEEFNSLARSALDPGGWLRMEIGPATGTGEEKGRAREEGGKAE